MANLKTTWSACVDDGAWVVYDADKVRRSTLPIFDHQALFRAATSKACMAWIERDRPEIAALYMKDAPL